MRTKQRQSKKAAKVSNRVKALAQAKDEPDTASSTSPAEAPQATAEPTKAL